MSKSKKNKKRVIKLTEEDYNNYVMSLKDETPVKGMRPTENEENK